MKKIIAILSLALMLSGCVTVMDNTRRQDYVASHPTMKPEFRDAVLDAKVYIGMTKDEVLASWGRPVRSNRSVSASGTGEQLIYGFESHPVYLYFDDGVLTSFQDSK